MLNPLLFGGTAQYQVSRSLRFNDDDSAYLDRTWGTPTNNKIWTFSVWLKRGNLGITGTILSAGAGVLSLLPGDTISWVDTTSGASKVSTPVYRDPTAWWHLLFVCDTTQGTAANRNRVYVNSNEITAWGTDTNATLNNGGLLNSAIAHNLGRNVAASNYFDGLLADVYFVDGQQLTSSDFAKTDTITGQWIPKQYAGTYGNNGFSLDFSDNSGTTSSTLGKDRSGNNNDWTPNNFSVAAGVGNDSLTDTPTEYADGSNGRGNHCTLSSVDNGGHTLTNGNLEIAAGVYRQTLGTFPMSSGKWYWEMTAKVTGTPDMLIGIAKTASTDLTVRVGNTSESYAYYNSTGNKSNNSSSVAYGNSWMTDGDVVSIAFDADNGKIWWAKNGTWQASGDPSAGTNAAYTGITNGPYAASSTVVTGTSALGQHNFGQRPFVYTPPTGFKTPNAQNLSTPSIVKPATAVDMDLFTGTSATRSTTGKLFQPDFAAFKQRSGANDWAIYDSMRGVEKRLEFNNTDAEVTGDTTGLTAFNSDGYTTGALAQLNTSAQTYFAWLLKKGAAYGFDIQTYMGDGSDPKLVSHNLGVPPDMVCVKRRDAAYDWVTWHRGLSGDRYEFYLNLANAEDDAGAGGRWGTTPVWSSTQFQVGAALNTNLATYDVLLFASVAGFSKFGSYVGNGSADGPMVHLGFRPLLTYSKYRDVAYGGFLRDAKRNTYNPLGIAQFLHNAQVEENSSTYYVDFLASGFKVLSTNAHVNTSSGVYVYAAFAETPFKYSRAR